MNTATREAIETIALAVFLILLLQVTIQNFRVEGPSMDPRLANNDRVLVAKAAYLELDAQRVTRFLPGISADEGETWHPFGAPSRGDVVVFRWPRDPSQNFVKRIIGIPGDTVQIFRGTVIINGVPLDEPYIQHESNETLGPRVVGEDEYYVLGDNRLQSDDSRHWGMVTTDHIIGRVWVDYWPLDHLATLLTRLAP
jgi:signal peptidase I